MAFSPNLQLFRLFALRHTYTTSIHNHSRILTSVRCWCSYPSRLLSLVTTPHHSLPLLRAHSNGDVPTLRHIGSQIPGSSKHHRQTDGQRIIIIISVSTFLLYFLWLREPNGLDEYMDRPVWERIPGITPERAEQMMEVDKSFGFQVDYAALEKYKEEYYAREFEKMEEEKHIRKKHQ